MLKVHRFRTEIIIMGVCIENVKRVKFFFLFFCRLISTTIRGGQSQARLVYHTTKAKLDL